MLRNKPSWNRKPFKCHFACRKQDQLEDKNITCPLPQKSTKLLFMLKHRDQEVKRQGERKKRAWKREKKRSDYLAWQKVDTFREKQSEISGDEKPKNFPEYIQVMLKLLVFTAKQTSSFTSKPLTKSVAQIGLMCIVWEKLEARANL